MDQWSRSTGLDRFLRRGQAPPMSEKERTKLQGRLEEAIGADLETWVRAFREKGASWQTIAIEVWDTAQMRVSHETLRAWFGGE